jgi:hypothetical protein
MVNYFTKVKSNIQPLTYDADVVINANTVKTYDIKTLMPDHANYDLRSTRVLVLVLNNEVGSLTRNSYVNSDAVATVGIDAQGIVKVHNTDISANQFIVRIDKPTVKK